MPSGAKKPRDLCTGVIQLASDVRGKWQEAHEFVRSQHPGDKLLNAYTESILRAVTQARQDFIRQRRRYQAVMEADRQKFQGLHFAARAYLHSLRALSRQCDDFLRHQADELLYQDNLTSAPGTSVAVQDPRTLRQANRRAVKELTDLLTRLRALRASLSDRTLAYGGLGVMEQELTAEKRAAERRGRQDSRHRPDVAVADRQRALLEWQLALQRSRVLCSRSERWLVRLVTLQ